MQYLVATDWMWFAVALLMGGAFGYWLPGRIGAGHLQRWGAAAFLIGLAVVALHVYPLRDEPDLEMILLPAFCFAIGGLLGRWLRAAISRAELARAVLAGDAQVESAVLGARAKAAVRSVQDAATSTEAKAAGEARLAEATKAAAAKVAAAKAAAAMAAVAKAAEEVRLAAEARTAEQARLAAITKAAEQARLAAEAKAAEEARVAAVAKTAVTETAEEVRPAAETKAAEEARLAAAVNAVQQERLATEAKAAEQARFAAADKSAEDEAMQGPDVAATTAQAGAFHSGSRPPGIVAPAEGEADDLKRIKGMGPEIEKACNALGIYQFRQIANWTPGEAIWVGHHIGFPGRIEREHWIAQARLLGSGAETEHSRAVKSGIVDRKADEPLDPAAAEMLGKSLPEQAAAVEGEDKHPGRRPYGLATPLGKADNLKRIRGIGPQNESRLHGLGIWHVSQIAAWTDENVKWVGSYLGSSGRIQRDNWVAQARDLAAAGKQTESSRRVAAGKVPPPKDDGSLGQDNVQAPK
jgi:predicted flap endonuclease-1-like 5' DNA nuclease